MSVLFISIDKLFLNTSIIFHEDVRYQILELLVCSFVLLTLYIVEIFLRR